jgi:TonB family protein
LKFKNTSDALTTEQKLILNSADMDADIVVKISLEEKDVTNVNSDDKKIKEVNYWITPSPDVEAQFPGGNPQMNYYLNENVISKITKPGSSEKIPPVSVEFMVNEEGQIINTKIYRTSADAQVDKLVVDAFANMPKWTPAKNAKGTIIKQKFVVSIGAVGC